MRHLSAKLKIYGPFRFFLYVLAELYLRLWRQGIRNSYSQRKEDLEIDKLLGFKKRGFYVDVGANDPVRFSNTYRFYKRGWRGINIEPDKESFREVESARTRDINLNIGVSSKSGFLEFHQFIPDTLSTFSKRKAKKYQGKGYLLKGKKKIKVKTLADVFNTYVGNKRIDFISVDTEGHDLDVLKGNDWNKYRPGVICVESAGELASSSKDSQVGVDEYLEKKGYKLYLDNGINSIYIEIEGLLREKYGTRK